MITVWVAGIWGRTYHTSRNCPRFPRRTAHQRALAEIQQAEPGLLKPCKTCADDGRRRCGMVTQKSSCGSGSTAHCSSAP